MIDAAAAAPAAVGKTNIVACSPQSDTWDETSECAHAIGKPNMETWKLLVGFAGSEARLVSIGLTIMLKHSNYSGPNPKCNGSVWTYIAKEEGFLAFYTKSSRN